MKFKDIEKRLKSKGFKRAGKYIDFFKHKDGCECVIIDGLFALMKSGSSGTLTNEPKMLPYSEKIFNQEFAKIK